MKFICIHLAFDVPGAVEISRKSREMFSEEASLDIDFRRKLESLKPELIKISTIANSISSSNFGIRLMFLERSTTFFGHPRSGLVIPEWNLSEVVVYDIDATGVIVE